MIGQLRGSVELLNGNLALIDVNGVGYEVSCSSRCAARLTEGDSCTVVIYTDVREGSLKLFGFDDLLEKQVFLLLMKVSGVGAKSASDLVSQIDKRELLRAIGGGDVNRLQQVRGVGKKTAERIVVELRDRVAELLPGKGGERGLSIEIDVTEPQRDAIEALMALGIPRRDAEQAVRSAAASGAGRSGEVNSSVLVKEALRFV